MAQWFRVYSDLVDDPKVQKMSPDLFKIWVNVLCLASRNDGLLPSIEDIDFGLRINNQEKTQRHMETLENIGLLDRAGEFLRPHNWYGRQFASDVSTERVKRFRNRFNGVSETPPEQNRSETDQIRSEQTPKPPSGAVCANGHAAHFAEFWKAYPKRVGKAAALKVWMRLKPDSTTRDAITVAIAKQSKSQQWRTEGGRYIPHPATWLNQGRWEDDAEFATTAPAGQNAGEDDWKF